MDLRPSEEQQQLVAAVAALLDKHATPDQVRAAEPLGFDRDLWERLAELGPVAMAVPAERGGWGASVLDLALVAEQLGRTLAPVPVIEAQVGARLLARLDGPAADAALAPAIDGGRLVTMALHPAHRRVARLVPAGAVASSCLVVDGEDVVLVDRSPDVRPVENLGAMPVADVPVPTDAARLAGGPAATDAVDAALDDWLALTASALVGLARRALDIGVAYVKDRRAWGVPVGSFQSVAHHLADAATAVDAAHLVALEAAWAADEAPARAGELAAMAFALAYDAARQATYWSLHFHGGYGFMMEYDIQLYYRRARAWATVFGGPTMVHRRIADKRYGPVAG